MSLLVVLINFLPRGDMSSAQITDLFPRVLATAALSPRGRSAPRLRATGATHLGLGEHLLGTRPGLTTDSQRLTCDL